MNLNNKHFLVIEDDYHIFELIRAMLKPYDIQLELEKEGDAGLEKALKNKYDLIILDIMLPGIDGWEVCRELKNKKVDTPVIMLTAKVEEADKVLGLELGADDYITKPFSPRETIARIKAVLRRFEKVDDSSEKLEFAEIDLEINPRSYTVNIGDEELDLTPKEFELLSFMASHRGQVFTRENLLNQIWGYDNYAETRTVDEHIKRLRKKMGEAGIDRDPLQTVWGVGYKFDFDD